MCKGYDIPSLKISLKRDIEEGQKCPMSLTWYNHRWYILWMEFDQKSHTKRGKFRNDFKVQNPYIRIIWQDCKSRKIANLGLRVTPKGQSQYKKYIVRPNGEHKVGGEKASTYNTNPLRAISGYCSGGKILKASPCLL